MLVRWLMHGKILNFLFYHILSQEISNFLFYHMHGKISRSTSRHCRTPPTRPTGEQAASFHLPPSATALMYRAILNCRPACLPIVLMISCSVSIVGDNVFLCSIRALLAKTYMRSLPIVLLTAMCNADCSLRGGSNVLLLLFGQRSAHESVSDRSRPVRGLESRQCVVVCWSQSGGKQSIGFWCCGYSCFLCS